MAATGPWQVCGMVCGSQMGKSDSVLDFMGWRLDTRPRPQLFFGPTQTTTEDIFYPKFQAMLEQVPSLHAKAAKGRFKKGFRIIAGVPVRFAWTGSASQMAGDTAGDVYVDEVDRMLEYVGKDGDPFAQTRVRGASYRDRRIIATSTPTLGTVEVEYDEESGLFFWKVADPDDVQSAIWRLFQSGTRHHWAWPCPHCGEYFIPRFDRLKWPKASNGKSCSPAVALDEAYLECPNCGSDGTVITEDDKTWMNGHGEYISPGQRIEPNGKIIGEPIKSRRLMTWVSGLCSPMVSFGERAADWLEAVESKKSSERQVSINTGFGELFSAGEGDVPAWQEVADIKSGHETGTVPDWVRVVTAGVDVQKDRIIYAIRGWGAAGRSHTIDYGEIWGETEHLEVWDQLQLLLHSDYDGIPIRMMFVDSGYRPGKPFAVPVHRVYQFCRKFPSNTRPTKGASTKPRKPVNISKIDVTIDGREYKKALHLAVLDTDHWKSRVHAKVRWGESAPGRWSVPVDVTQDYCEQIVSEARQQTKSKILWVKRAGENHLLDCESLNEACAGLLKLDLLREGRRPNRKPPEKRADPEEAAPEQKPKRKVGNARQKRPYIPRESIWQ